MSKSTKRKRITKDRTTQLLDDAFVAAVVTGSLVVAVIGYVATDSFWPLTVWLVTIIASVVLVMKGHLVPKDLVKQQHAALKEENQAFRRMFEAQEPGKG